MKAITAVLQDATANLPKTATLDENPGVAARDWAGFFAALAQFATVLLPLILPLFKTTTTAHKS